MKQTIENLSEECEALRKELEEAQILNQDLNKENKEKTLKIGRLEARISGLVEELKRYNQAGGN